MQRVRRSLLTAKVTIVQASDPLALFWQPFEQRVKLKQAGEASQRSALQSVFDVWESKLMLDKALGQSLGADATAKHWRDNVDKKYKVEEPHTPAMIDA